MFIQTNFILVVLAHHAARQVACALQRQTLNQQTRSYVRVSSKYQGGVELLALQHVVLQNFAQPFNRLALVIEQWHHPLVGLLPRKFNLRIQSDCATALVGDIDHLAQIRMGWYKRHHRGRCAQCKVRLHLDHGQFDRAVTHDLQNQSTVKFDVGLHQNASGHHLAQHSAHGLGIPAVLAIGGTPTQNFCPAIGQAHDAASNRQSIK